MEKFFSKLDNFCNWLMTLYMPNYIQFVGTFLHMAAREGHFEIVKFIMERVNNKSPVDYAGCTPLACAACGGYLDVCDLIESMTEDC